MRNFKSFVLELVSMAGLNLAAELCRKLLMAS